METIELIIDYHHEAVDICISKNNRESYYPTVRVSSLNRVLPFCGETISIKDDSDIAYYSYKIKYKIKHCNSEQNS